MHTSRPFRTTLLAAGVALPVLAVVTMMGTGLAQARVTSETVLVLDKVQICHANNDDKKPYVLNTPSASGDASGHADHLGDVWNDGMKAAHQSWGDIIPPYLYDSGDGILSFPGLNWTTEGQAIWNNSCVIPTLVDPPPVVETTAPAVVVETTAPAVVVETTAPAVVVETTAPAVVVETTSPAAVVATTAPAVVVETTAPAGQGSGAASQGVVSSAPPVTDPTVDPTEEPTADPTDQAAADPTDEPTTDATDEPTVVSSQIEQDATTSGDGAPQTFTGGSGTLAFTGAPIATYVVLSFGLLAGGGLLVLLGRRRSVQ